MNQIVDSFMVWPRCLLNYLATAATPYNLAYLPISARSLRLYLNACTYTQTYCNNLYSELLNVDVHISLPLIWTTLLRFCLLVDNSLQFLIDTSYCQTRDKAR